MFRIPNHANSRFKKRAFPLFGGEGYVSPRLFLDYAGQTFWDAAAVKTFLEAHTFARDGEGTFKDAAGDLKVKGYNICLQSEDLDTTWVTARATKSGTKLTEDVGGPNTHLIKQDTITVAVSEDYNFSVEAKEGGRNWVYLFTNDPGVGDFRTWFNLADGTIGTTAAEHTPTITDLGNGEYRIGVGVATTGIQVTMNVQVALSEADGVKNYIGDGVSGAYFDKMQLATGIEVKEYSKTVAAANSGPRFNHEVTSHQNVLTCSEAFSNVAWSKSRGAVAANVAVSPDGTLTADRFTEDTATGLHRTYQSQTKNAGAYSESVYAKADTASIIYLRLTSTAGINRHAWFDLSAGTVGTVEDDLTASIESLSDGWYRCSIVIDNTFAASSSTVIGMASADGVSSYTGDGVSAVYLWGGMLETGSATRPYIQTWAAAVSEVTQTAEVVEVLGADLVTNGDFAADSDWTKGTGVTISGGAAIGTGSSGTVVEQAIALADNTIYRVSADITLNSGTGYLKWGTSTDLMPFAETGHYSIIVTHLATADDVIRIYSTNFDGTVDNVSVVPVSYTAAPKGLMSEEERVNLLEYAECNDGVGWLDISGSVSTNLTGNILGRFIGVSVASNGSVTDGLGTASDRSMDTGTTYSITAFYQAGTSGGVKVALRSSGIESGAQGVIGSLVNGDEAVGAVTILSEELQADGVTWMLKFTIACTNTATDYALKITPFSEVVGETVIAVAAQLEEGDKPTSLMLSEGAAKARPEDVCSRDIEKTDRTNLLTVSQYFSDWAIASDTVVNAADAIAPDGTTTADQLIDDESAGTGNVEVIYAATVATSTAYVFSVFAKADGVGFLRMRQSAFTVDAASAWFDLDAGVVGTLNAGFSSSGIEDAGNGWYRCWASFTTDGSDTTGNLNVIVSQADGVDVVDLDGTSSIHIWGAQLELGAAPTDYISTGVNLLTYSEEFNDADWIKSNTTITADQAFAPDGTDTADHIQHSLTSGSPDAAQPVTVASGATMTFSIYVKASVVGIFRLLVNNSSNHFGGWFDPATGLWGTTSDGGTATLDAVAVEALSNGWYRISVTGDIPSVTEYSIRCYLVAADGSTTRSLTAEMFIWGAACNVGSELLSYHITEAAAAAARTVSEWPWWNPIGGVFVVEWDNDSAIDAEAYAFHAHDGASNNALQIYRNTGTDKVRIFSIDGGVTGGVNSTVDFSGNHKAAVAIANGVLTRFTVDGESTITHTKMCGTDVINTLAIAMNEDDVRQVGGTLKSIVYYPDPNMSDADLQALSGR